MKQTAEDFTQKCLTSILPSIENMIQKEKEYISKLEKDKNDIIKKQGKGFWIKIFMPEPSILVKHLDECIEQAKVILKGLEKNKKEYEDFVLKNW